MKEVACNNYYNEIDPFAAAWLRILIREGHIAKGEVDERSIAEVQPKDLKGFTQCHFFAGIGVWSYALRRAGWPDDARVWTGSCPCQSFSASGKRGGFSDQRHLWPEWCRLIRECKPDVCFGEQVASKDGRAWLDIVCSDLESAGYAVGAADLCAAGFGAPHIRQRLYFVADAGREQKLSTAKRRLYTNAGSGGADGIMVNTDCGGQYRREDIIEQVGSGNGNIAKSASQQFDCTVDNSISDGWRTRRIANREHDRLIHSTASEDGELGDTIHAGPQRRIRGRQDTGWQDQSRHAGRDGSTDILRGFWRDAEWIYCRDQKYRSVEPGTFPLAHGATNRVGRLRGYGNAINAEVAKGFIEAYLEVCRGQGTKPVTPP